MVPFVARPEQTGLSCGVAGTRLLSQRVCRSGTAVVLAMSTLGRAPWGPLLIPARRAAVHLVAVPLPKQRSVYETSRTDSIVPPSTCSGASTPPPNGCPFGGSGSGFQPDLSFRPRGFSPPRRLPPHRESRVCCTPLPILGFAAFHLASCAIAGCTEATILATRFVPLEEVHSIAAALRHRSRCPRAVSTTSRLCSATEFRHRRRAVADVPW